MFLGLAWYWWIVLAVVCLFCIFLKVKFIKWWSKHQAEKKNVRRDKWGEDK